MDPVRIHPFLDEVNFLLERTGFPIQTISSTPDYYIARYAGPPGQQIDFRKSLLDLLEDAYIQNVDAISFIGTNFVAFISVVQ